MIFSKSSLAESGYVFKTNFLDRGEMIWIVTRYDPPYAIQYTIFKADSHFWNLEILLSRLDEKHTHLNWNHTFTGITKERNRYISEYSDEHHGSHLSKIEKSLAYFVKTGKRLHMNEKNDE